MVKSLCIVSVYYYTRCDVYFEKFCIKDKNSFVGTPTDGRTSGRAITVVVELINHINIYMSSGKLFKIDASNASEQTDKKEVQDKRIIDCSM